MGVPILETLNVVEIGKSEDVTPLIYDKYPYESDGIVFLNKVKPHTDFRGNSESGLAKMMAIGIANHTGASIFHRMRNNYFADRIPRFAKCF